MHQVVSRVVAAIPGRFIVHQHMNPGGVCRFFHRERVLQADGQRLFHHDVNAVAGTDLHHAPVVERIRVNQNGLRMHFRQHLFEIGKEHVGGKVVSGGILRQELLVWLGDSYDRNLRTVQRSLQESVDVSMNQANDSDAERSGRLGGRLTVTKGRNKRCSEQDSGDDPGHEDPPRAQNQTGIERSRHSKSDNENSVICGQLPVLRGH